MKTVIITGSANGFGYEMLKLFRENNCNVVLTDINEDDINTSLEKLLTIKSEGSVLPVKCDVTNLSDINNLITKTIDTFGSIDIFINNAGVNQPDKYIWELDEKTINMLIDIDLKGTILCTSRISEYMIKQGYGSIYVVEGHGSDDSYLPKLTLYGTAKRGLTYFIQSLYSEVKDKNVIVGRITPGIMMTKFIHNDVNKNKIDIPKKTKNIYNILGDYPETIAKYMVPRIINNKKNNVKFAWLTTARASGRFIKALFGIKNNFFK